jgi:acyl dehydratase
MPRRHKFSFSFHLAYSQIMELTVDKSSLTLYIVRLRQVISDKHTLQPDYAIGDKATLTKKFTEADVVAFASLSLDDNPIHLDSDAAAKSIFGMRVVHGMLVASLFSALLGTKLPGKGSIYMGQKLRFTAPVFIGDVITATVEIINIRTDKPIVTLRTTAHNQDGIMVIDGEAVMRT